MKKGKKIEEPFDIAIHYKKQNEYLRYSFQENLDNYGFQKQSQREQEQENIEITPKKSMRPMSAYTSFSQGFSSRQRPITAPGLNLQVKHMMKINENEEMISAPYHSETKYWRNTKKFDKTNQNVIRNHSALQKVSLGGDSEIYNIEEEETKNQNMMEKQIIKNRLFSPMQGQPKHQINDRDIQYLTEGFYQHVALIKGTQPQQKTFKHSNLQICDNLVDIMKLISGQTYTKSPVVYKTKPQGLRPQSAVNKQGKVNQRYRPVSGKVQSIAIRGFQL
ncbi:unnamed protein product [Paramecium primaurelia]|uniref:Uncharacterized protein n=1 Tax=Paramecium primaurelia TaxID=5886 RepID=A0A8S1PVV7_PARPR|nr:unnamed protein product [Paramecium primaurelia]